jgi:hypothetical protein
VQEATAAPTAWPPPQATTRPLPHATTTIHTNKHAHTHREGEPGVVHHLDPPPLERRAGRRAGEGIQASASGEEVQVNALGKEVQATAPSRAGEGSAASTSGEDPPCRR